MRENVDAWSARQSDEPGRSEAIRRLVELGLASAQRTGARTNKAAKASDLQARKLIVWVIRPQPTRNGNSQAKTSQGTERVPRYSQQREDYALNLREPAPTSWTPQSDRLYMPHPAHRKRTGAVWEL